MQYSEEEIKQLMPLLIARSRPDTSDASSFEATVKPSGELRVKGPATAEAGELLQQLYWLASQNSQQQAQQQKEQSIIASLSSCAEGCIAMLLLLFLVCGFGWAVVRSMEPKQPISYPTAPLRSYPTPMPY